MVFFWSILFSHLNLQGIFLTQGSTEVSYISDRFFITWATREAQISASDYFFPFKVFVELSWSTFCVRMLTKSQHCSFPTFLSADHLRQELSPSFQPTLLFFIYLFFCFLKKFLFFSFIFISWRLITLQYSGGFYHTLTWISQGFTCVPHPDPPSHLPLLPIPLGLPSAPGPSTCLMHPAWAGDLFHPR